MTDLAKRAFQIVMLWAICGPSITCLADDGFKMTGVVVTDESIGFVMNQPIDSLSFLDWSNINATQYTFDSQDQFDVDNTKGTCLSLKIGSGYTRPVASGGYSENKRIVFFNVSNLNRDKSRSHAFRISFNGLQSQDGEYLGGESGKFEKVFVYDQLPTKEARESDVDRDKQQEDVTDSPKDEPTAAQQDDPELPLEPGTTVYIDFPALGKTSKGKETRAGLYLPENYSKEKLYPLLVTFGGGSGTSDPKRAIKITGGQDFICVGVPYRAENKENDGIWQTDWEYYHTILNKIESVVPNIDCKRRACTGFSSGGAAILYQIGASDGQFQKYFHAFMPCGAGWPMGGLESIEGRPMLAVMGANDKRLPNFRALEKAAVEARIDFQLRVVPDAGHKIPSNEFPRMKDWLVEKLQLSNSEEQ